jgi:hypothetical protein
MKIINIQEAFSRKIQRQQELADNFSLPQFHCGGNCFHIGKVSFGCLGCFHKQGSILKLGFRLGEEAGLPNVCNFACPHCFPSCNGNFVAGAYAVPLNWTLPEEIKDNWLANLNNLQEPLEYMIYTFTGAESEPLFYLPVIEQSMDFCINVLEPIAKLRGYAKVYTNGVFLDDTRIQRLVDMRIDEVRVNISASRFSEKVYANIAKAVEKISTVTVEVPLWEPNRKKIFEMLPIINDLGVKHLNVCQIEIHNEESFNKIAEDLPSDTECFQVGRDMLNIDDKGFCEDLMREVLERKYSYSVIDCNAFVKLVYQSSSFANGVTFDAEAFVECPKA